MARNRRRLLLFFHSRQPPVMLRTDTETAVNVAMWMLPLCVVEPDAPSSLISFVFLPFEISRAYIFNHFFELPRDAPCHDTRDVVRALALMNDPSISLSSPLNSSARRMVIYYFSNIPTCAFLKRLENPHSTV